MLKSHRRPARFVVSGVRDDARAENLIYLQRTLQDHGHEVINLGAGLPDQDVVDACLGARPDVLVISTLDGRRYRDVARRVRTVRGHVALASLRVVFGGRLSPEDDPDAGAVRARELTEGGYDAVFECAADLDEFSDFLCGLRIRRRPPAAQPDLPSVPHRPAQIGETGCPS
jgi:methylmalonyl-CoA mutase cobalamin-binding subunit